MWSNYIYDKKKDKMNHLKNKSSFYESLSEINCSIEIIE